MQTAPDRVLSSEPRTGAHMVRRPVQRSNGRFGKVANEFYVGALVVGIVVVVVGVIAGIVSFTMSVSRWVALAD